MELVKQKFPVIVVFPPHETDLATYVQAQLLEDITRRKLVHTNQPFDLAVATHARKMHTKISI